jgi:hypothetical protein
VRGSSFDACVGENGVGGVMRAWAGIGSAAADHLRGAVGRGSDVAPSGSRRNAVLGNGDRGDRCDDTGDGVDRLVVLAGGDRQREGSAELVLPPAVVGSDRGAPGRERRGGDRRCDETCDDAQLRDRRCDSKLNAVRGSTTCEGRSHPSHAPVEYARIVHQVADRSPGRSGDIAAPMYVGGEEGAKPRKLARRIGASLRIGTGVYSAAVTRAGWVSGAALDGPPRKRSSSHPKTSAMVPQTSS